MNDIRKQKNARQIHKMAMVRNQYKLIKKIATPHNRAITSEPHIALIYDKNSAIESPYNGLASYTKIFTVSIR